MAVMLSFLYCQILQSLYVRQLTEVRLLLYPLAGMPKIFPERAENDFRKLKQLNFMFESRSTILSLKGS